MKVADIKKLKVAELRSRLKELGLDNKGLKAELVGRLWSALEAGQGGEDGEEDLKLQQDASPTPAAPTDTVHVRAPSSEAGVTARCKVDRAREVTDSATQTETDTGLPKPQQGPEFTSECGAGEGPGEDRRARSSEEGDRGRAFYEFKEEIRYKR